MVRNIRPNYPPGRYDVHFRFFEGGGDAYFDLSWESTTQPYSSYQLPYPDGSTYRVTAGNDGHHATGTNALYNRYAWDFATPVGSQIVASRGGTVISLYEGSNTNTYNTNLPSQTYTNYVVVDHGDGTSALYAHLQQNGVVVNIGDRVQQNQLIAYSGNTGNSTGPHLHYSVQKTPPSTNYGNSSYGYWRESLPSSFSDPNVLAQNPDGIPVRNRFYTS
jgi:murein DD-endopeptidase MepM/ murein hydrolase activator NlpD